MDGLSDRRVLVTGAASGIGRAAVVRLAAAGARVAAIDIDAQAGGGLLREAQGPATPTFIRADVSREEDVAAAVEGAAATLGGLDVVIHAAGIMAGQLLPLETFDEPTWNRVVDVNLKGGFLVAKHAARIMIPAGTGVIVLVASKGGVSTGSGSYAYGASKGGLHGLALTLERHLGPQGIRVNDLCPGDIDTPLMRRSLEEAIARGGDPVAVDQIRSRLVTPAAVADVLAFLASDAARCVRGSIFTA